MHASFNKHLLEFKTPAQTSRGAYSTRTVYILSLEQNGIKALGEASPLPGLSIDAEEKMEEMLSSVCAYINQKKDLYELDDAMQLKLFPCIQFALECAFENLKNKATHLIFPSAFTTKAEGIPVNGLIWMDTPGKMREQVEKKINEGYSCIKLKIGALDFDQECRLLESIRQRYSAFKLELRVDANGAFSAGDAASVLKDLVRFELHSIEQPIQTGQWDAMQKLCAEGRVPIALDEELIGVEMNGAMQTLLKHIRPRYIILKPTLLGGFKACDRWIKNAADQNIGFWITSALESNIGLNAIAQYCGKLHLTIPQGLGTGALFTNNFEPTLEIKNGIIYYL